MLGIGRPNRVDLEWKLWEKHWNRANEKEIPKVERSTPWVELEDRVRKRA